MQPEGWGSQDLPQPGCYRRDRQGEEVQANPIEK